jgi:hypothetical protein
LTKRVLILVAVLVALGAAAASPARADYVSSRCPTYSSPIAYVTLNETGAPLVGVAGNVWATKNATQYVAIYRLGAQSFCAVTYETGTFTTVAGTSPAGTGTIAGGITGTFTSGTRTTTFSGKWNQSAQLSGFAGSVTSDTAFLSLFFSEESGFANVWYAANFYTSRSCYSNSYLGIRGDIIA